jgi:hypothetical protein
VLIIGTPTRFERGKQIGTYVGTIPCEESSAHTRCGLGRLHQQEAQQGTALLADASQSLLVSSRVENEDGDFRLV